MSHNPRPKWTADEDAILRRLYPLALRHVRTDMATLRVALPRRSAASIKARAGQLGLTLRRVWIAEEDELLRAMWGASETSVPEMAERLRRTPHAVYHHATVTLGLPAGCPDGWEYVTTAARRTGFSPMAMRRVLAAAGVEPQAAVSLSKSYKPGKRAQIVEPEAVDRAVAAWLEAEPLHSAAERLGVCDQTLARRLEAVGVTKPATRKAHWRVRPDEIERALAAQPVTPRRRAA